MKRERLDAADVQRENRQLRAALKELLDQLDDEPKIDCDRIRDLMPGGEGDQNGIQPPWEREGYDKKQEWIEDNRSE